MIDKIRIQNFKCLRDVEVEFGPFNVLIGPNDSGKSSLFDSILWLAKDSYGGDNSSYFWRKNTENSIIVQVAGKLSTPFEYQLEMRPGIPPSESLKISNDLVFKTEGAKVQVNVKGLNLTALAGTSIIQHLWNHKKNAGRGIIPTLDAFITFLHSNRAYQLDPREMRQPSEGPPNAELASLLTLEPTGRNLAAVLAGILSGPDRQAILDLEKQLHREIPTLRGVSTPPAGTVGKYQIQFTLDVDARPPITIPSAQASDGAMLLLGFLVIAYSTAPGILLIEEPENGLHPSRLKMVVELLRKISTGEIGNQARQVVLTTHSPLLLNFVKPEEVRIFSRNEDGATRIVPMNTVPGIERLQKEFAPGELWYLFGEDELVKGLAK